MWVSIFLVRTKGIIWYQNDLVVRIFFCFVSLPYLVSVGAVMQDANVSKRHQANMTPLVTLQALSNDVLLIAKLVILA